MKQLLLDVERHRRPQIAASVLKRVRVAPGLRTRLIGVRHRVELPHGLAVAQPKGADPALACKFSPCRADQHEVVVDQWRHADEIAVAGLRNLPRPQLFTGFAVHRQEITVPGAAHHLAVLNGGAALGDERLVVSRLPFGLPDDFAARTIERYGMVSSRGVKGAIVNDGRRLRGLLVGKAVAADLGEIRGVLRSDLVERRVALATIVVIYVRPVGAIIGGVVQFRLCRTGRVRGTGSQQQSGNASGYNGSGSHGSCPLSRSSECTTTDIAARPL
jgi:hypothetical protein